MNIIVRVLHLVIAIVLLSPLVDIVLPNCGMQSGDIKNQLLFNIPKVLFGGMPPPLEAENWFFYSVSVAVVLVTSSVVPLVTRSWPGISVSPEPSLEL